MKPNEVSFAESFGLSNASLNAIKKRELKNVEPSSAPQNAVPLVDVNYPGRSATTILAGGRRGIN